MGMEFKDSIGAREKYDCDCVDRNSVQGCTLLRLVKPPNDYDIDYDYCYCQEAAAQGVEYEETRQRERR